MRLSPTRARGVFFLTLSCVGVVLLLLTGAVEGKAGEVSDVVVLTDANFDEVVDGSSDSWLLEFYAPWCGHCKHLAPIWEEAASELVGQLRFGKIDCTYEKATARRFEVRSYPTLKFYREGEVRPYKGSRTVQAFKQFGADVSSPPLSPASAHDLSVIMETAPVSFVMLGASASSSSTAHEVMEVVAHRKQGLFKFLVPKNKEAEFKIAKMMDVDDLSTTCIVYASADADRLQFRGPWTVEALVEWVGEHALPVVSELGPTNFEAVTGSGKLTVFAVSDPDMTFYRDAFLKVAKQLDVKKETVFAYIDGVKFKQYVSQFGFNPSNTPAVFVLDHPNEYYWTSPELTTNGGTPLEEDELSQAIEDFVADVLAGELPAQSTIAWYSSVRLLRKIDKFTEQFTEFQIYASVGIMTLLIGVFMYSVCGKIFDLDLPEPEPANDNVVIAEEKEKIQEISQEEFKLQRKLRLEESKKRS